MVPALQQTASPLKDTPELPMFVKWSVLQMAHLWCGQRSLFRQNHTCHQEGEGGDSKVRAEERKGGRERKQRMKAPRSDRKEK